MMHQKHNSKHKETNQIESHNMFDSENKNKERQNVKRKAIILCILTVFISCSICSYLFYQNGYQYGNAQGYGAGFEDGKNEGYLTGNTEGFQQGYEKGKRYSNNSTHSLTGGYNNNEYHSTKDLCSVNNCSNSKKFGSDYCFRHGCLDANCYNRRANNLTMYCKDHKCAVPDCNSGASYNSQYCLLHQ